MGTKANGAILWSGPSALDGQPIVVIAIGTANGSTNRKTGSMLQTYIIRSDVAPTDAIRSGADASICGDCVHRGDGDGKHRTCYVNIGQGPTAVYKAFRAGRYPTVENVTAIGAGRMVRLGTYGDPAAVPAEVWVRLLAAAAGHTGYTHQWRRIDVHVWAPLVMASADTATDARDAWAAGWRTFRVATSGAKVDAREVLCPASKEAGAKVQCDTCRACNGTATAKRGSIFIPAHGGTAVMANVGRLEARLIARG